jgi:hypothetical protein
MKGGRKKEDEEEGHGYIERGRCVGAWMWIEENMEQGWLDVNNSMRRNSGLNAPREG